MIPAMRTLRLLSVAALASLLAHAANAASSMDDAFDGLSLDSCRWEEASYKGAASQSGELILATEGSEAFDLARVLLRPASSAISMFRSTTAALPASMRRCRNLRLRSHS